MALRKEEERKQMHNKTGGGVFNLIFRRGKSSMGSGSISSDTRSISPTHSDDSRSVTPPAVIQQPILSPPKQDPPPERPKPPQRKRRPAPKPPQLTPPQQEIPKEETAIDAEHSKESRRNSEEKPASTVSEVSELQSKKSETGLVICHSRNSSDSSGYHEASVLSDNCNTSLPRRPKSAFVGSTDIEKLSKMHSQSTTNLTKMASHSKSTTSLGLTGRKKKAAPPPPPAVRASNPSINLEPASPVVASQSTTHTKESLSSHQALDNLASITSCSIDTLTDSTDVIKPFGSTDSGIAPETNEKLSEVEDLQPITPPPPPIFVDEPTEFVEPGKEPHEELQEKVEERLEEAPVIEEAEKSIEPISETITSENESLTELSIETEKENLEEIDWQYQLPSPPKAFRDSSPIRNEDTLSEAKSVSITDFKDSVVTCPELFEKLKSIEDTQSVQSVSTFVGEEPPLNTLSLENLEKRKTLVYNRELSTSLKMNEKDTFSHSLNKFEKTYIEVQKSSQKEMREPKFVPKSNTNTLPNFKISTYDRPKQKLKVFEDDTVRSNTEYINRSKETDIERQTYSSTLNRSFAATSMENISARKISVDSQPEEREYNFFRPDKVNTARNFGPVSSVFRSESFSKENTWSPPKPVSRSKSFLALNWQGKYKIEKQNKEGEGMERSNSLYDVSGLQSLGVMRLIQNKLNTPTTSLENINAPDQSKAKIDHPRETPITKLSLVETIEKPVSTERIYKYRGPPSINMGTWSDRPKVPVSVKEDEDYTLGNTVSTKLIVNTTNNNVTSNNRIEIKTSNKEVQSSNEPSISIKVNGSEVPTTTTDTKTGNVVIKIGPSSNSQPKIIDNQTFINHTTAVGYRKPFNDINKNQRPYSIAFSSEYDMSRVPVVRSVELKKPFKDFGNTSVTQISPDATADNKPHNDFLEDRKAALRINSFTPHGAPVVRGFKSLPKQKESFQPNSQVPFSQVTLRRTESSKILNEPKEPEVKPPPPPMMPKVSLKKSTIKHVEPILDPRDQLLSQIRNFGGKKGLKSVKV